MTSDVTVALIEAGLILTLALVCRLVVSSRLPLEVVPSMLRHRVEVADRWTPAVLVVVGPATFLGLTLHVVL